MKLLLVLVMSIVLIGCEQQSGGGSSSNTKDTTVSDNKISMIFTDSTLTRFDQTAGVATYRPSWMDFMISRAYALDGNINCYEGEQVSFDMDITLGSSTEDIQVDTTCGDDVDLAIRREMLAALDGHVLILEIAGNGGTGVDYKLDFNYLYGFQFDIPYPTLEERKTYSSVTRDCMVDYTFNSADGTVTSSIKDTTYAQRALGLNEAANDAWGFSNPHTPVSADSFRGCLTVEGDQDRTAHFRFINGKIELDESGTKKFSQNGCINDAGDYKENGDGNGGCPDAGYESTYERWCIDDDLDGTCDSL